jgi:Pumilio-family RNA binding repeat
MLPEIMVDNYGNYFCQKLLTNCSADQRMQILERISEDFVSICCDKRGTHTVQTFIDLVNLEKEIKYFQRVLHGHVADLSLVRTIPLTK